VGGQVTLADGTPVVGAQVVLQTDDPRFDASLVTDAQGNYAYGTATTLGGAPPGTEYRVRIAPGETDYVVQMKADAPGEVDKILAAMPPGTEVEDRGDGDSRQLTLNTTPAKELPLEAGAAWSILRATAVPDKYADPGTSGLTITVEREPMFAVKRKQYDLRLEP
jgi:hypothetical protein